MTADDRAAVGTRRCDWCLTNPSERVTATRWACSASCDFLLRSTIIGAGKLGIPVREYRRHVRAGEKWCHACARWHMRELFGVRRSAHDGLNNLCRKAETARVIAYQTRTRKESA